MIPDFDVINNFKKLPGGMNFAMFLLDHRKLQNSSNYLNTQFRIILECYIRNTFDFLLMVINFLLSNWSQKRVSQVYTNS